MPPRKRAETKPEPPDAVEASETETPDVEPAPEAPDGAPDSGAAPDEPDGPETAPAKSDLQAVDLPCGDCFPNGWPDSGFGLGCEHGTWYRKS